ncbi:ABC transporter permease subunit [Fructobacillus sp. M2-14]|uniref:ABC transporter permease subunit n=1 Tax=Fructobacillus broussonetiae TaxID=2713173 RepID=A0ABS5QZV7_9LACO|nr:ABC transporter permease subunit [Fructobacillus broussonetiae]MBS9338709.1 ABC transporter permease subunit [Fructobacillus broussonetiae]
MITLLKQEWMKAVKQNRFYIWAIIAFLLPVATLTWIVPAEQQQLGYSALGGAGIVIAIAGSVFAALTFTQEFSFGTIRPLLSRQYSRLQIFISKIIIIFVEYVLTLIAGILGTLAGRGVFTLLNGSFGTEIDWQPFLFAQVMDVLMMLFYFAIVLLVSNMAKSSAAAISIGVVLSIATPIISSITTFLVRFWEPLKWNPLTVQGMLSSIFDGRSASNEFIQNYFGADIWVVWLVYTIYLVLIYIGTFAIFQRRSV